MKLRSPRSLSCGIVILNAHRELLLCHVTGHEHWDLPKGGIDPGETPTQAALRETFEETGLRLQAAELVELGPFDYRPDKGLHLFAALTPRFDVAQLRCESHFFERWTGRRLPEMDGYGWFDLAQVPARCTRRMAEVLGRKLDLRQVLRDVMARAQLALAA